MATACLARWSGRSRAGRGSLVTADNVVKIGGGERVKRGQGLGVTGQRRAAAKRPALVRDRDQAGPYRGGGVVPASPSQPTASPVLVVLVLLLALSVLVKTSYSWAEPESIATSGTARAPSESMLAGTTPLCQAGSDSTAGPQAAAAQRRRRCRLRPGNFARGVVTRVVARRVKHDRRAANGNDVRRSSGIATRRSCECRCRTSPESPEAARKVTPGVVKSESSDFSCAAAIAVSPRP